MGNSARVALSLLCLCVVAGVRATDEGGDNVAAASAIASVVLMASLVLLFSINIWQARYLRRLHGR